MAKGFTQIEGIDYKEIFSCGEIYLYSPTLTLVTRLDVELFQMDVTIFFLNGNIEKEIYMDQPIGFV